MPMTITVEIPDNVLSFWGEESDLSKTLSVLSVVELVRDRKLSAGKACEILGLSRWDFMSLLAHHNVPTANFSESELDQQIVDS